jgi:hypothetical protein
MGAGTWTNRGSFDTGPWSGLLEATQEFAIE